MPLSNLDLNLLKVLNALLRHRSTTRAGEEVGLSQPAVSAALSRLRAALGDDLFLRQGQNFVPTEFARSLEKPLQGALNELQQLLGSRSDWRPETSTEVLRLSGIDFWADMLMPDLARLVFEKAPGMRLQLLDLVPDTSVDMLDKHRIDIALLPRFKTPNWIVSQPLFWSPFVAIARDGHPALRDIAPGALMPMEIFLALNHVLLSPDGKLKAMGDVALAQLGHSRKVSMSQPFFSGVARTVAATDAIALMPLQYVQSKADEFGLTLYQPPVTAEAPMLEMIWHRRRTTNPAHKWLRDQIAALCAPMNAGHPPLPKGN